MIVVERYSFEIPGWYVDPSSRDAVAIIVALEELTQLRRKWAGRLDQRVHVRFGST